MNTEARRPDEHVARKPAVWLSVFGASSVGLFVLVRRGGREGALTAAVVGGVGVTMWLFFAAKANEWFFTGERTPLSSRTSTWFGVWAVVASPLAAVSVLTFGFPIGDALFVGLSVGAGLAVSLFLLSLCYRAIFLA